MSRRKDQSPGFFGMGTSLLLTVLLVLMLVTFSLLSLATARNDLRSSELLAQRRTEYYEANNQAQRVLSQITRGQTPEIPVTQQGNTLSYTIPMAGGQSLHVSLLLEGEQCTVLSWAVEQK